MSTDHTEELVSALRDIKDTLAAQTEHLKTNSLLLQALLELNQRAAGTRPATGQTEKIPTSEPADLKANAHNDDGEPQQSRLSTQAKAPPYATAEPNAIPNWEVLPEWRLRDSYALRLQKEQKWYHIDDHLFTTPRPLDLQYVRASLSQHVYVPYPFSMTGRVNDSEEQGLGDYADIIVDVLNNLYSLPADARLPLGFEPLSLRRMKRRRQLDEYLIKATQFLHKLHEAIGYFIIWDHDDSGNSFCYYPSDLMWSERDRLFDLFPITKDSVRWHRHNEHRRVDRYYELIPQDIYVEFFKLLITRQHWYASDWATCSRKWFGDGIPAYLDRSTQATRPWYRIIDVDGLERMNGPDVASTFVHFLFSKHTPAMDFDFHETGLSLADHLEVAVIQHLKADPLWGTAITGNGQWDTFHISWYGLSEEPYESCWGHGPFYLQEGLFLSRQSFSVTIYCSNFDTADTAEGSGPYWTMLVLPPPGFYVFPGDAGNTFWTSSVNVRTGVLEFIDRALSHAADAWAGLDPYFDRLDAKRELIFNPEQHDSLLFDDRHFSRSRRYFWAINSLGRFIQDINVTIERWERFWQENERDFRKTEQHLMDKHTEFQGKTRCGERSVDDLHASIVIRIQSLKNTRESFEARRQKIIEYRDGLFNASSVIETREATRLSQNVKLLTFVSIFYLPLGFCMSMWSINEDYNTTNLVVVTICIGLATYAVVANLETTVHTLQRGVSLLFNTPRQRLVKKMMVEGDTRWKSLGEEMAKAPLSREDAKPSEWLIFGYWCTTIYRSLKGLRRTTQERVAEHAKPTEDPPEKWLASIYQSLQSVKEKPAETLPYTREEEREAQMQWIRGLGEKLAKERNQRMEDKKSGEAKGAEQTNTNENDVSIQDYISAQFGQRKALRDRLRDA